MPRAIHNSRLRRLFAACALAATTTALPGTPTQSQTAPTKSKLTYRWVWSMHNMQSDEQVTALLALMKRAKAAGYNGFALSDYKFNVLDRVPAHYFENVAKVKALAQELGLTLVPTVAPIGYSNGLLAHDPNLAEGLPVREAVFVAKGREADVAPAGSPLFRNGGFEDSHDNKLAGFDLQDVPGTGTFVDTEIKHSGNASLRLENIGKADPQFQHGRVMQPITVAPFRQYHLSVWIKTQDWDTPNDVHSTLLTPAGRVIAFNNWHLDRTKDWTQFDTVFNSQNNTKVNVYLGVWGGKTGKLWMDDVRVDEVGLLNVVRRQGCPLVVKSETGTVYREGDDYETVADPKMGRVPWEGEYDVYHTPPTLHLTSNSRIKPGQRLRVSFYHTLTIYDGQESSCISDPKVYALLQDQMTRVQKLMTPKGYFLSHDEFRIANWCEDCQKRNLTPGQMLADNTRRCIQLARQATPGAQIFVWSDMFDPFHNAVADNYYLVNGPWTGAWEGLPKDAVIVNWNPDKAKESLPFFAKRGNPQILAGYYDGDPKSIRTWLDAAKDVPGIEGVMYTTWGQNYGGLEEFAHSAWGQPLKP